MDAGLMLQIFLIGIGLSMDAFAVAVCQGLKMKKIHFNQTLLIALFFGGFQALMPFLGWAVGRYFRDYIEKVDHWIAFVLLAVIGFNMIREGWKGGEEEKGEEASALSIIQLLGMAVATSIDALAIGVTFAFLDYPIFSSITMIGCTTFILSLVGVAVGNYFGVKYKNKAEIVGGAILIFIGTNILIDHLGIFL